METVPVINANASASNRSRLGIIYYFAQGFLPNQSGCSSFRSGSVYQRLLNFIVPDFVHVLVDGRIVKTGGKDLALELEAKGYDWILKSIAA